MLRNRIVDHESGVWSSILVACNEADRYRDNIQVNSWLDTTKYLSEAAELAPKDQNNCQDIAPTITIRILVGGPSSRVSPPLVQRMQSRYHSIHCNKTTCGSRHASNTRYIGHTQHAGAQHA
jgi:hypothetical protein